MEYDQQLIQAFYSTYLGRQGSASKTSFWARSLQQGTPDEQVVDALLASGEYFQRSHVYPGAASSEDQGCRMKSLASSFIPDPSLMASPLPPAVS
jgi:hypothetical protein